VTLAVIALLNILGALAFAMSEMLSAQRPEGRNTNTDARRDDMCASPVTTDSDSPVSALENSVV
jgi:hypothetical protein